MQLEIAQLQVLKEQICSSKLKYSSSLYSAHSMRTALIDRSRLHVPVKENGIYSR
jgi:hypothetical protein